MGTGLTGVGEGVVGCAGGGGVVVIFSTNARNTICTKYRAKKGYYSTKK